MKNYLNFESDIKNLETELDKLKDPYNQEGLSEVDTNKISKIQEEIDTKLKNIYSKLDPWEYNELNTTTIPAAFNAFVICMKTMVLISSLVSDFISWSLQITKAIRMITRYPPFSIFGIVFSSFSNTPYSP